MHPLLVLLLCSPVLGPAPPYYPSTDGYSAYSAEPAQFSASGTQIPLSLQVLLDPSREVSSWEGH